MSEARIRQFDELVDMALHILPKMAGPDGALSQKTVVEGGSYRNVGSNDLYTAMALIGILEGDHAADPRVAPLVGPALERLATAIGETTDGAVLAAAAWALALADDPRVATAVDRMEAVVDPGRATSMQLGLVAAGCSVAAQRCPAARDHAVLVAKAACEELLERWSAPGSVFRGQRFAMDLRTLTHFRWASFASQVYPLLGLSMADQHLGQALPKQARETADWLVEAQGPHGEWWWWYGVRQRRVVEGYPVYSVHQYAMAHMALAPVQRITGAYYLDALGKGMAWLDGVNPLGAAMLEPDPPVSHRAIQRSGGDADGFSGLSVAQYVLGVMSSMRVSLRSPTEVAADNLEVLRECRPYELGWILLAKAFVDQLETADAASSS